MSILLSASMVVSGQTDIDCNVIPLKNCFTSSISIAANCDLGKLLPVLEEMQNPDQIKFDNLTQVIDQVQQVLDGVCVVRPFCQPANKPCCIKTIVDNLDKNKIDQETYNTITTFSQHDPCVKSPVKTTEYCIPLMIEDLNNTLVEYFETHSTDEPFNKTDFSSRLESCKDGSDGNGCYHALDAGPIIREFAKYAEPELNDLASQYNITNFDINNYLPLCPTSAPTQATSSNKPTTAPTSPVASSAFVNNCNSFMILISMIVGFLFM